MTGEVKGVIRRLLVAMADTAPAFRVRARPVAGGFWRRLLIAFSDCSPAFAAAGLAVRTPEAGQAVAQPASPASLSPVRPPRISDQEDTGPVRLGGNRSRTPRQWLAIPAAAMTVLVVAAGAFTAGELVGAGRSSKPVHVTSPSLAPYARLMDPGSLGAEDIAFSPDGRALAVADRNGTTYEWNPATGHLTAAFTARSGGALTAVAFAPSDMTIAAGGVLGRVLLWNALTGKIAATLQCPGSTAISDLAFSPDGVLLAAASLSGHGVCLWDLAARDRLTLLHGGSRGTTSVAFSPDGATLAAGNLDGHIYLWNSVSKNLIAREAGPDNSGIAAVTFSPHGDMLAVGDVEGRTRLLRVSTGRYSGPLMADSGPSAGVVAISFSPDGSSLAVADGDGTTYLRKLPTGKVESVLADPESSGTSSAAFSPDGAILATSDHSGTVYLWRPQGKHQRRRPTANPAAVVEQYFAAINAHDYRRAWDLGGKNTTPGLSYASFVQGFAKTAADTVLVLSVDGNRVTVSFTALETDGSTKTFQGSFNVSKGAIVSFSLQPVG